MERTQPNDTAVAEQELTEPLTRHSRTSYDQDISYSLHNEGVHLASIAEKRRLWWRNAIINTLFIASWFFFATILSVYNKWMFSASHFGFPAPLFVTTMHMFVQFSLAALLRSLWPKKFKSKGSPSRKDYATKAAPTALATGMDIGLSNLSLKTITLSFYTMCKSSSLIFVLLFAFIFRLEIFSWRLVAVILLIFSGVVLMVATEAHFVLEGLILVLSASALGGLRWSLTQVLLRNKKMGMDNPASTIFWLSPAMGLSLGIVSAIVENWSSMFRSEFFKGVSQIMATIFYLTAPGVIAFCMVLSEFYIIQRTGVVPMSIAGIAKEVSTILISTWFFGDKLTWVNAVGVSITVCGIGLFTHHKYSKSMESNVPLDAHGNPILDEDESGCPVGDRNGDDELSEERIPLTLSNREVNIDEESGPNDVLLSKREGDQMDRVGDFTEEAPEFQRYSGDSGQTGYSGYKNVSDGGGSASETVASNVRPGWKG